MKDKGENGGILCSKPIYGYKKDPDNKNHWLIDEEAAGVVRSIFDYCTSGLGTTQIANILRDNGIPTPRQYFIEKGLFKTNAEKYKNSFWEITCIRGMLRNREYCGDIVNFKTYRKSYRDHTLCKNSPENYCVFKGVNDPIISEEQFQTVQELLDKRCRVPTVREKDMFQGYLYCADCGKRLSINRSCRKDGASAYCCNTYKRNSKVCTSHYIRYDVLKEFTLKQIRKLLYTAKNNLNKFALKLQADLNIKTEKELKASKEEIEKLRYRSLEINKIITKLYEDRALEKISEERYSTIAASLEGELREINEKVEKNQSALLSENQTAGLIGKFVDSIKKYDDITELNQYVLLDLVDKIIIRQRQEGQNYEDFIDINFKGIGKIFFED